MTPEQALQLKKLKEDVDSFSAYKDSIDREQISFPLDAESQKVIHRDIFIPTGNVVFPYSLVSYDEFAQVDVDGKKYLLITTKVF